MQIEDRWRRPVFLPPAPIQWLSRSATRTRSSACSGFPARDGWGEPIEVYLRRDELPAEQVVVIRSPGRDGVFDSDCYTVGPFDGEDADQDIVWADGFFMRWPEGSAGLSNGDTFPDSTDRGDPGSLAPSPGAPGARDAVDPKESPSR